MGKRVIQFDKRGKVVAVYENVNAAVKATGFDAANIGKNLMGIGSPYIKGYQFK